MSVRRHLQRIRDGMAAIEASPLPSVDATFQALVRRVSSDAYTCWQHASQEGFFSSNEQLDDFTTLGLELLPVPYYAAVLAQKVVLSPPPLAANGPSAADQLAAQRSAMHQQRQKALVFSNDSFMTFLRSCVELGLLDQRVLASRVVSKADARDRTSRIQAMQEKKALEQQIEQLDGQLQLSKVRARRVRQLAREDDDDNDGGRNSNGTAEAASRSSGADTAARCDDDVVDDLDDENEEDRRARNIAHVKWCIIDAIANLQLNNRELELLGALTPEQQRQAVDEYQQSLLQAAPPHAARGEAATGPQRIGQVSAAYLAARSVMGGNGTASSADPNDADDDALASGPLTILPGGAVIPMQNLRQRVYREAFLNRNQPTMTLAEFAEGEMRKMAADVEAGKAIAEAKAAEEARLGEEGVEERERQRQAKWDDWKDANPPQSISQRGNYS